MKAASTDFDSVARGQQATLAETEFGRGEVTRCGAKAPGWTYLYSIGYAVDRVR